MADSQNSMLDKVGIPKHLAWGYLGILIFMMGDGVEQGLVKPVPVRPGANHTGIGIVVYSLWGNHCYLVLVFGRTGRKLWAQKNHDDGRITLYTGHDRFCGLWCASFAFPVMLATYALRGFGYPLFAYSFLVWITYRSPQQKLGTAVGWFWFVFTGGLNVFGAYYSSWAIQHLGYNQD
jgi:hypothetical protein